MRYMGFGGASNGFENKVLGRPVFKIFKAFLKIYVENGVLGGFGGVLEPLNHVVLSRYRLTYVEVLSMYLLEGK